MNRDSHAISNSLEWQSRAAALTNVSEEYVKLLRWIFGRYDDEPWRDEWIPEIDKGISGLLAREQYVLRRRMQAITLQKLSEPDEVGVTRERVRQIESKALLKLRHPKYGICRLMFAALKGK